MNLLMLFGQEPPHPVVGAKPVVLEKVDSRFESKPKNQRKKDGVENILNSPYMKDRSERMVKRRKALQQFIVKNGPQLYEQIRAQFTEVTDSVLYVDLRTLVDEGKLQVIKGVHLKCWAGPDVKISAGSGKPGRRPGPLRKIHDVIRPHLSGEWQSTREIGIKLLPAGIHINHTCLGLRRMRDAGEVEYRKLHPKKAAEWRLVNN